MQWGCQPSFSQQIQLIEGHLGGAIVERGQRANLTPLGRDAVAAARRVLAEVEAFTALSERESQGLAGTIRLGASPTLGPYILPKLVAQLHSTNPGLRVHIREGLPSSLIEQLAVGEHDVALVQLPVNDTRFCVERLFREPLYLAMATDDPLREFASVPVAKLAGRGILTLQPQYRMSAQAAAIAEQAGAFILGDYEGTSLNAIRQMAGLGMGLAILPELYVRQEIRGDGDVIVRPFTGGRYYRDIGLVWRVGAGRADAFTTLAAMIKKAAEA